MTVLFSPVTERVLKSDTPHSLSDGTTRWPVVDGIPFLRVSREALASEALARLDAGDRDGALVLLLADQDDWWSGPRAAPEALRELVRDAGELSLRDAMARLSWGPVADYFAHRWSDPTFLAGLALVEAHWNAPRSTFELACGIGHHLRALTSLKVPTMGADVVFAKLWVARHWVAQHAHLCCFDAAHPWPIAGQDFDLVTCHDAFYFLEPKRVIADQLRALLSDRGVLAVGHVHNSEWPNFSAGSAVSAQQLAALFPSAVVYDDAELTSAVVDRRAPMAATMAALGSVEAFSLAEGPAIAPARALVGGLVLPAEGAVLRKNPLYGDDGCLVWPSERYAREYGPRATYPECTSGPECAELNAGTTLKALRRELVELPERW